MFWIVKFTRECVWCTESWPAWLNGRELARETNEPGSNTSQDASVHLVCETFNVMHTFRNHLTLNVP